MKKWRIVDARWFSLEKGLNLHLGISRTVSRMQKHHHTDLKASGHLRYLKAVKWIQNSSIRTEMRAECLWHTWNDLLKGRRAKNNRPANLKANKTSTAHLGSWKLPALQERKDLILPKIIMCFSLKKKRAVQNQSQTQSTTLYDT